MTYGANMPSAKQGLGRSGEAAAAAYLIRCGYHLEARNWRCPHGELDLVARLDEQIVFVEVKTRRSGPWHPEEAINRAKARRLIALAYAYLEAHGLPPTVAWRIDLIAVEVGVHGELVRLEQIVHAVEEA